MSNVISLDERLYAARISDLLFYAYEKQDQRLIALAASLATKAINHGITQSDLLQAEQEIYGS
ncbi:hypothetical protein D9M70_579720 [compost metagenome]